MPPKSKGLIEAHNKIKDMFDMFLKSDDDWEKWVKEIYRGNRAKFIHKREMYKKEIECSIRNSLL
jgi:hypothetical protein